MGKISILGVPSPSRSIDIDAKPNMHTAGRVLRASRSFDRLALCLRYGEEEPNSLLFSDKCLFSLSGPLHDSTDPDPPSPFFPKFEVDLSATMARKFVTQYESCIVCGMKARPWPSRTFGHISPAEERARSLAVSERSLSLRLGCWTERFPQARLVCVYPKWLLCHKCRIWRRRWVRGVVSLLDVWPLDSVLICCDYPLMKGPNVSACSQRALVRESEGASLAGSFCPDFHPAATWDTRNLAHTH